MVEWICPHCGGKEYSSWNREDKEKVRCIYCGKEYPNPYNRPWCSGDGKDGKVDGANA